MAVSKNIFERVGIGLALCVALFMFFSPLVILHGAFVGDEAVNGLHVAPRLAQLRSGLDAASSRVSQDRADSPDSATQSPAISKPLDVPLSLRMASLVPLAIFAAFAFAALALLDLFFIRKATGTLAFLGGCFGLLAIVHLMFMDSGLRAWTAELIATEPLGTHEDPFVAMRILANLSRSPPRSCVPRGDLHKPECFPVRFVSRILGDILLFGYGSSPDAQSGRGRLREPRRTRLRRKSR